MKTEEKAKLLEEILDLDEGTLDLDAKLEDIEEWDSLSALSFVVMIKDEFNKKISGQEIRTFKTVRDLLDVME